MAKTDKTKPSSADPKQGGAKKAPPKAAAPTKAGAAHTAPPAPAPKHSVSKPAPVAEKKAPPSAGRKAPRFSKADLKEFQLELIAMRDRIADQSGSMRTAALQRSDEINPEEDGTDAFLRLQTLEQVGTQQGIVTKINEALHAISQGTYGVCDSCGELISKERLSVLPFARNCIKCQSEMEWSVRHGRFR